MEKPILIAVGTYTDKIEHAPNACGKGIILLSLNEEAGELKHISFVGGMRNPSYIHYNPVFKRLYALTESDTEHGEILAYRVNDDNTLSQTGEQMGSGRAGCHLVSDTKNSSLFTASYQDGTLGEYGLVNGEPTKILSCYTYKGSGPNKIRQECPHAHQVMIDPESNNLYVCDLGSDTIWKHKRVGAGRTAETALNLPAGYGPRHLAFDPEGGYIYILCEITPRLLTAKINRADGTIDIVQDLPSARFENMDKAAPAAIKIHPSGKSIAVSNRFDDSVGIFRIERNRKEKSVVLSSSGFFSSIGKTPRDIAFTPSGKWLMIANQDSNDIQLRQFNQKTGLPEENWGSSLKVGTPVCLISIC